MKKTAFKRIRIGQEWYTLYIKEPSERVHIKGNISACYERPSDIKSAIFNACVRRANDIAQFVGAYVGESGVSSYNCMMFTYAANFYKEISDGLACVMYYYETKTRREIHITSEFLNVLCDRIQTLTGQGYSVSIELA